MMRRISLAAASVAMLAVSALPASAAMASTTHKFAFPGSTGVKAWGTWTKVAKGIKVNVCAQDTKSGVFASGAVVEAFNSTKKLHTNIGAVAFGHPNSICRSMTLRYSAHMQIYTFTANNKGMITHTSKKKNVF
jgi:hypothetical protein